MSDASAAFALTLLRLPGVGRRTAVSILAEFEEPGELRAAGDPRLQELIGKRGFTSIERASDSDWALAAERAVAELAQHDRAGVRLVPFGSDGYPPLLAASPDPPAVLYVRGDPIWLNAPITVAVVGTRTPTARGREIARRVARRFAEGGAVVISGLAKGIDTAGHEGALEAGKTVAVLGTAIDKVYPAENKALARRIEERGALVSEYAIGSVNRSQTFVERDRIQAGLSLAVVPVQTGLKGGTQHTIRFAIDANRPLLCPRPSDLEFDAPENEGILELLRLGRATAFEGEDIARLVTELANVRRRLLGNAADNGRPPQVQSEATVPKRRRRRSHQNDGQIGWIPPDMPTAGEGDRAATAGVRHELTTLDEVVSALDNTLDRLGPNFDEQGFDGVIRAWRARRYPNG